MVYVTHAGALPAGLAASLWKGGPKPAARSVRPPQSTDPSWEGRILQKYIRPFWMRLAMQEDQKHRLVAIFPFAHILFQLALLWFFSKSNLTFLVDLFLCLLLEVVYSCTIPTKGSWEIAELMDDSRERNSGQCVCRWFDMIFMRISRSLQLSDEAKIVRSSRLHLVDWLIELCDVSGWLSLPARPAASTHPANLITGRYRLLSSSLQLGLKKEIWYLFAKRDNSFFLSRTVCLAAARWDVNKASRKLTEDEKRELSLCTVWWGSVVDSGRLRPRTPLTAWGFVSRIIQFSAGSAQGQHLESGSSGLDFWFAGLDALTKTLVLRKVLSRQTFCRKEHGLKHLTERGVSAET